MEMSLRSSFYFFVVVQACSICSNVVTVSGQTVSSGETYPMCFDNITGGGMFYDVGFVQIYGFSVNNTKIRVSALTSNVDEFSTVGLKIGTTFNFTTDYDSVTFITPNDVSGNEPTGIIPSSSDVTFFNGVKSDKGSTDAFLALPLLKTSTEFILSAWPYQPPFDASCSIIPALNNTCVELYKFFPDGSAVMLASTSVNQYETFRYFATFTVEGNGSRGLSQDEDMTGYYVNATKPIQVLCGHECANVPPTTPFCDHIVEQIPPIPQLGKYHVVPPIGGRSPSAGYVVRVVAANEFTEVTWKSPSLRGNSTTLRFGQFTEIVTYQTMEALVVECNVTCLVMQYNKGRRAVSKDIPSDPFMMLTVPSDRFQEDAGFATPNYCNNAKQKIEFDNWATIVTFASDKGKIRIDNNEISNFTTNQWDVTSVPGYAIVTFRISHQFHYVSVMPLKSGKFACYVYGHSIIDTSASAYGFSANYKLIGEAVSDVWEKSETAFDQYENSLKNHTCAEEKYFNGELVLKDDYVPFPFTLSASFTPVAMSDDCFQLYNQSLWNQLTNLTRLINYWICATYNCSYLNGEGVAINYATLAVQFQKDSQDRYIGVMVTVEVAASLDTSTVGFATCRVEIREYMRNFMNWPSSSRYLLPPLESSGCPSSLNFPEDSFVTVVNSDTCLTMM